MTKVQQMQAAGILVIESLSSEATGSYAFEAMTPEQQRLLNGILAGYQASISTDEPVIIGDGVDEITLTISGGEPNTTVTVNTLTGDTAGTLSILLDDTGNGSQVFSCETSPTVITFTAGESTCKVRAL